MFCSPNRRQHMRPRPKMLSLFDATTKEDDDDDVPLIQALRSGSFSPAASVSSSASIRSNDEKKKKNFIEKKKKNFIHPHYNLSMDDVNDLMMAPECVEEYNALQQKTPSSTRSYLLQDDECYVSMEYSNLKQLSSIQREIKKDSILRKTLIDEELNQLIQICQDFDYLAGHEFEPEAVEALGIAANQLAYKKKYYDVARSDYVYVPSVAYTIMNGSLLELASAHYFGKSEEEFLIAYAGAMGSAILTQKHQYQKYMSQEREEHPLAEEFDIQSQGDDSQEDAPMVLDPDHVMRLVWGVSPKASSMMGGNHCFTFDDKEEEIQITTQRRGWKMVMQSLLMVVVLGAASFLLLATEHQQSWMNDVAEVTAASSKAVAAEMPRMVQESWNPVQTWMSESQQHVSRVGAFWQEQLAALQEHMKEETVPYQVPSSPQNPEVQEKPTTKVVRSPLFGDRSEQKAFVSAEECQTAINANQEVATKKLLANMEGPGVKAIVSTKEFQSDINANLDVATMRLLTNMKGPGVRLPAALAPETQSNVVVKKTKTRRINNPIVLNLLY
jgi:hypothetical protein